ncbi:transcriptional regulator [Mergibacter septicus]|uniref:HI1506-related protein n=1 Tax=Mergibacter septicus TaxID=221402 RepID=UPI00117943AE|nr:HI1506-related protein [Mergibacter septicus]AWX14269.1 transcriptional regulator [Mergibacter septicus]
MARSKKAEKEEAKVAEADKIAEVDKIAEADKAEETDKADEENKSEEADKFAEVKAVGVSVQLNQTHPHSSYGRAGYRFYKDKVVDISLSELTAEQIQQLDADPYLTVIFITE